MQGLKAAGQEVPVLDSRPVLNRWVGWYYSAFTALSSSRPISHAGAGPIPLTEIKAYLDLDGFDTEGEDAVYERQRFVYMIRALDTVFLDHIKKTSKQEATKGKLAPGKMGGKGSARRRGR